MQKINQLMHTKKKASTLFLINFSKQTQQQALIYIRLVKEEKEEKFKLSLIDCLLNA